MEPPTESQAHELTLTFDELVLVYQSLQAVKTLGTLPPEDELLDDTIHAVDQALDIVLRAHRVSLLVAAEPRS
ncbi:MAG TPA: hypothetical protein VEG40_01245 [Gaiellaceae bacterium]|nr:hypothetical protein [Gaiellaceae bacterium]